MSEAFEPDPIVVALTPKEAMTVLAAVRQYEPYWPGHLDGAEVAGRLADLSGDITSIIAKVRCAAASSPAA